jgi:hypothetical protein
MKHMGWYLFFAANELPALTNVLGGKAPAGPTIIGSIGFAVFLFIIWIFVRVGMFRGLKFRHYIFMLSLLLVAAAGGYLLGTP